MDEKVVALPHPLGSHRFENIEAKNAFINNLGTIKVDKASYTSQGFLRYKVYYSGYYDAPVSKVDSFLSDNDKAAVAGFINLYGLTSYSHSMSQREIILRLKSIFQSDYRYSLKTKPMQLEGFLNRKKSGHCEYFATATVLILRNLGIPCRYITGFSVKERYKELYIVRQRHAHAWAMANFNGKWIDIDTTPGTGDDSEDASIIEPITDFFQGIYFDFLLWRADGGVERNKSIIYGILVIALIYLLIKTKSLSLLRLQYKKTIKDDNIVSTINPSPFIELQKKISVDIFPRQDCESLMEWVGRIKETGRLNDRIEELKTIITLHYRYRFYSNSDEIFEELDRRVKGWLEGYL
jgi:hypothetical protein